MKKKRAYRCSLCGGNDHTKASCGAKKTLSSQDELGRSWARDQNEKEEIKGRMIQGVLGGMIEAGAFTSTSIPLYLIAAAIYHKRGKNEQ